MTALPHNKGVSAPDQSNPVSNWRSLGDLAAKLAADLAKKAAAK